jgi:CelD/BcsL family acetyltransferase involved in cellulose biosynthesis
MEKMREDWNRLVLKIQTATPFQSWEWNFGMAKYNDPHVRLRIVVAEDKNGQMVGIAPFWIRSSGLPGLNVLEFIGSHPSDYSDIIFLNDYKDGFVNALKEWSDENKEWRIAHFENLRWNLGELGNRDGSSEFRPSFICPYASLPKTMGEYELKLRKNLRRTIRRQRKLLGSDGRMSFSTSQTTSQLKADLPVLFDLHQQRLRVKGERGRFFDKHWIETFKEISLMMQQAGFLKFGVMRIDGQPAACVYNFRLHKREYAYLGGMAADYAQHSPGSLLHHYMIEEAINDGVQIYDFCRGDESYKYSWTNEKFQLSEMILTRSKAGGYIWRRWESWREALYRSRFIKRVYLATVGKFQS